MAQITVKTLSGKDAGSVELPANVFGVQPNVPLMHQVVTAQLAARRSGTQSTKTRAEVSGGGRKPFKQKGTGNARQGSIRSPHYSGGGVALGPKPRKYDQKTPKKMIRAALASALSDRAAEGKVMVIEDWGFDAPKTKQAVAALSALGIDGKALVVVEPSDTNAIKSFLNLPAVQLIERSELNAYDVLCNDVIVFTKATLPTAEQFTAKRSSLLSAGDARPMADRDEASVGDETQGGSGDSEPAPVDEDLPAGAAAPTADGSAPNGFDIKGNADSMLYHVPGSRFYDRTVAEIWFATAEDAEAAGYQLPPSQRDDESDEEQS
jgi:large subunit ribosomal protein L4